MRKHQKINIEYCEKLSNMSKCQGVYLIGGIYVGATKRIRRRVIQHVNNCINNRSGVNQNLYLYITDCISKNNPIKVSLLSENPNDEIFYSLQYKSQNKKERFYHQIYK